MRKVTVNLDKVKFVRDEISCFLGHLVSAKGIKIDPEGTQGIRDFPQRCKGYRPLCGYVSILSKFIPNVAEISVPLNKFRQKDGRFVWGDEQ